MFLMPQVWRFEFLALEIIKLPRCNVRQPSTVQPLVSRLDLYRPRASLLKRRNVGNSDVRDFLLENPEKGRKRRSSNKGVVSMDIVKSPQRKDKAEVVAAAGPTPVVEPST